MKVELSLPQGWVEVPAKGRRRILGRDPYTLLAQGLIASGAVNAALLRSTRNYLERVAPHEELDLAGAAFVNASGSTDADLANYLVVGPSRDMGGSPELATLAELLSRPEAADAGPRQVTIVEVAAGRAARARWARTEGERRAEVVRYLVLTEGAGVLSFLGSTDSDSRREQLVADFDAISSTARVVES